MTVANGIATPSKEQVASQAKRLGRILESGNATIKSLGLIAEAVGKPLGDLLPYLSGNSTLLAASTAPGLDDGQSRAEGEGRNGDPAWLAPETETGRLYLRLNKASELTANRTNVVRDEAGLPVLTLQHQLYVRRDVEAEIARALDGGTSDTPFIVIDGEAGTGKSSVLWATERGLRETGAPAWLIDATELPGIFARGQGGSILSDSFRELVRNLAATGRAPIVMIDTLDVPLNRSGADVYVTSLLTELALADVTVIAASRPGEARMLSAHNPRKILLFDYTDSELARAVAAYAGAYVRGGSRLTPESHAELLLDAAAQGFPINEICRNPLTLRMLYAVYAPQDINFQDIDVIALYREFWRRRVESDLRTDAAMPRTDQADLSEPAMRIALAMLLAGAPELPRDRLTRELHAAGLDRGCLEQLQARGVVRVSNIGPEHLVGFFHQTFFEHAAALAIMRLGGRKAIAALARRWAEYEGNLFLGAVLERVLVLSEYELPPAQEEAERVMAALGPGGKALRAYVFVHRRSVPESLAGEIGARVAERETLTVERILAIGANAVRPRRLALIDTLGSILTAENSRWVRRSLELLLRFASPDLAEVRRVILDADIGRRILKDASKHTQSRELYLRFLALNFSDDREWSLAELARFFSDAIKRQSEKSCLDVIETAASVVALEPRLVRGLEAAAGLDRPHIASRITSEDVARRMGELYSACWRSEEVDIEEAIREVANKRGLAMWARLHALGDMILAASPATASRAFELTGSLEDATVRIMAARITWTRCLPAMIENWPPEDIAAVTRRAKELAGNPLASERNGHADILYHVLRHGVFTQDLAGNLLDEHALADAGPWLDTRTLGHRLVQGVAAGIAGAETAFATLTRKPSEHRLLARAALAQLKESPISEGSQAIALRLAVATKNAEAAVDVLGQCAAFPRGCASLIPPLREMAEMSRRTGNPKTVRTGSGLVLELVRLHADPDLTWDALVARLAGETDDLSLGKITRALCMTAEIPDGSRKARMRWLLDFARDKGPSAREAVLELYGRVAEDEPELASDAIEELFDLAFEEPTDGGLIEKLQAPLFGLYRDNDPRALALARALIERSAPLPPQTCHRVCGTFKRLFGLIVERMDRRATDRLLSDVPRLHRRLGRMIVEGVARAGGEGLAAKLKAIAENPQTDPEIVTLAGRFLHRELRTGGIERWSELYELLGSR
jgi:hypothetical protein